MHAPFSHSTLVGSFDSVYDGQVLQDGQLKLRYRNRHGRVQFATDAFFFTEGSAEKYADAKYGGLRVSANGELLLNTLRGEDYVVLGKNSPN